MLITYKPRRHRHSHGGHLSDRTYLYTDIAVGECTRIATDGGAAFRRQMALAAISCQSIRQVAGHTGHCALECGHSYDSQS